MPGPSPVPATSWTIATSTIISGEAMTLDFASLFNDLPPMLSPSTSVRSVANLSADIDLPPLSMRDLDDENRSPLGLPPTPMRPSTCDDGTKQSCCRRARVKVHHQSACTSHRERDRRRQHAVTYH
ncbi:hypothetical protein QAD02_007428 [Eretmocerus hayati]|uniref:Uncharacterized protein n=1 Tax=Eretmocerus hayati TaxID=131215 RepID=A0ACC2N3Y1_9HYME|nr:hypothetical protein QAD02_007428 [Eretmocerus hayati]